MAEDAPAKSHGFSVDWLVKGTLTRVGDIFDRVTGRGWKPSSSLATSELIERMKSLMDAEVREDPNGRRYVPHNVQLKMQWDKFSTDSEVALKKLENEFLIAAVDHINDRHYYTYAPISIEIKPDYFTSGVVLLVGFDKFDPEENERAISVTVDGPTEVDRLQETVPERTTLKVQIAFQAGGNEVDKTVELEAGKRISVGRTKENGLQIDDQSISKAHASLLFSKDGKLVVADTGSTNGTFVNGERIAYGKAVEVGAGTQVMFGLVKVSLTFSLPEHVAKTQTHSPRTESYKVGDMEFSTRNAADLPPTAPSIPVSRLRENEKDKNDRSEIVDPSKSTGPGVRVVSPQPAVTEPSIELTEKGSDTK